jgi:TetR/AcrR family transcriptional regulator, fatty acid biosynthesis regulator
MPTSADQRQTASKAQPKEAGENMPKRQYGEGRQKLLAATARMVAREGSIRGLTLRDLAKEAGMSHNAIYRHFDGVEAIVQVLLVDFNRRLRDGLRQSRASVPSREGSPRTVVGWLLDFAHENPDVFILAMRERHGPSGPIRQTIEQGIALVMADMSAELRASNRLPALPDDKLSVALKVIILHTFELCLTCIDAPQQRRALLDEAEQIFMWCLAGASMAATAPIKP